MPNTFRLRNLLFVIDNEEGKLPRGGEVEDRVQTRLTGKATLGERRTKGDFNDISPSSHQTFFTTFVYVKHEAMNSESGPSRCSASGSSCVTAAMYSQVQIPRYWIPMEVRLLTPPPTAFTLGLA
jgi:hypothetical protein